MELLIKNVTVVNADGLTPDVDILVRGGKIAKISANISADCKTIDREGLHAFPGFIDMHCHLRDPGLTHKEDIASGTRSAAAGGYSAVCCMPNTKPPVDSAAAVEDIICRAAKDGSCAVLPVASITKGMAGEALTDFAALKAAGAIALSDDGLPVEDDAVMMEAMVRAKEQGILLMLHEEDLKNRGAGVANAGEAAAAAGLAGIPNAIEDSMTARDIFYAQLKGGRIHVCHVSTAGSVELIRRAKKNRVEVTCETAPHYFTLTDEAVRGGDPNAKMNPPLRSEADRQAVIAGILDGTIDAIATDHAPHAKQEKGSDFATAPFGIIGFETALPLAITELYNSGKISLEYIARLLSARPAELLGVAGGRLAEGETANMALVDIKERYTYTADDIFSKSQNSPFLGRELCGKVVYTIFGGNVTHGE